MNRYTTPLLLAALALLTGCQGLLSPSPTIVDLTPPPTSAPLSTSTPTPELPSATPAPTVQATPTDTATPVPRNTSTPQLPTPTPSPTMAEARPTRVVPPPEAISLPSGFGISVFAEGLSGPRMMALGPDGAIYVAERGRNRIVRLPDRNRDGIADAVEAVSPQLNAPSSVAFYEDGSLYVGETTRILRLSEPNADGVWQKVGVVIDGLPPDGEHTTRTVLFSPDWQWLYVSIGSSCNVCIEQDPRRAAVLRYTSSGSDEIIFATGLRNAVGMTFRPGTDELWVTDNGRDYMGDNEPPDTVYLIHQGDNAGWPRCHAGRIVDPEFGGPGACDGVLQPKLDLQAHSAPLGLTFYTGQQFPQQYRGGMFIAFHGSWNRTVPTGYKVVHVPMQGSTPGTVEDFAAGWLRADGSHWGRPVDVLTGADGSLYVSDDWGGRIYRIYYAGP